MQIPGLEKREQGCKQEQKINYTGSSTEDRVKNSLLRFKPLANEKDNECSKVQQRQCLKLWSV